MSPDPRASGPRRQGPAGPRLLGRLFPQPGPTVAEALETYPALLRRTLILRPAMEREMPRQIRDLSLSLTAEREGGPKPGYLGDPRTLAAYAWYFLPWNLLRLSRLLPSLDLDLPEDGLVCDLGAGPLTLVQALWIARPDLRRKRLRFLCVDRSRRALDLGLGLFAGLAGFDPTTGDAPWRVRVLRGEYWQGLAEGADMVAMVNVANELSGSSREPLDERMERLAAQLAETLAPGGRALVVEPGTRLGWRCLLGMREAFLEMGLGLAAPCPHRRECPLRESRARAWCHFNISLDGAPGWLDAVSRRAGLGKERLSLSFLLARKAAVPPEKDAVRVVSGAFSLTDTPGSAVYGCSDRGLLVLVAPDRRPPAPGDLLAVAVPEKPSTDAKSGAPRVFLPGDPAEAPAPARPRPDARERPEQPRSGRPRPGAAGRGGDRPRSSSPPGASAPSGRTGRPRKPGSGGKRPAPGGAGGGKTGKRERSGKS